MTLALIPARGGSKALPRKNLAPLAGRPLLFYTLAAAKNARCIDELVLSSDDEEMLEYAVSQGARVLRRPAELAQDDTPSTAVLSHALGHFDCENVIFDTVIFLQPTSPLRSAAHIEAAFEIFTRENADALISVKACDNKILKAFTLDKNGNLRGIAGDEYPFMPRQKLPPTFLSNGAIYILKTRAFLENPSFLQPRTKYFLMDEKSSTDIDVAADLAVAEGVMAGEG